jgi:hypothetical protein
MSLRDELEGRARDYVDRRNLVIGKQFGFGVHGIVFAAKS